MKCKHLVHITGWLDFFDVSISATTSWDSNTTTSYKHHKIPALPPALCHAPLSLEKPLRSCQVQRDVPRSRGGNLGNGHWSNSQRHRHLSLLLYTSDPQKMISNNPGPIVAHSTPSPTLRRGTWRKRKKTLSSCNFCKKKQRQVPLLQFWRRKCQKSPTPINTMSFWGLPTWDFWISDLRYPAYHHAPLDPKLWWFFGSVHSPQPETLPPSHPQK